MKILVSDTSVLIDLERGALLEIAFELSFEFAVPDLLFEYELREYNGNDLLSLGLRVEELDENGVAAALTFRRERPVLSLPDSFALALAKANSWVLLTGDRALRELASDHEVRCYGALWLIDQMHEQSVASPTALRDGLDLIASHKRCRLPRAATNARLRKFTALIDE